MRRILFSTIKILVSLALLYLALRKVDLTELASRINNLASLGWIVMAITVTFLQILVGVLRWREISAECGAPLGLGQAMRFNLISDPHGRTALLLVDFAALSGGLGFLVFGALPWPWLRRLWGMHHLHACAVIANRVIFSQKHGPAIAVLSLLVHVLAVVIAWCVVQSIAAPVVFGQIFQLVPPVMLITMLPISIAGWGVREASMALAFGYAGLLPNEGVNISLLYGAVTFLVGAFGGLVWIFSAEKAAQGAAPIEVPE